MDRGDGPSMHHGDVGNMRTHSAEFRVPARSDAFEAALEGLTRVNVGLMQRQPFPPLYEAGVRYRDEPRDVWRHAVDVNGEKWGDCEDLAAYRAAELRVSGEDPDAYVTVYQSGPGRFHAVVARSGGLVEDPSRALGMGAPKMAANGRNVANVVGVDDTGSRDITFELVQVPAGWGKRGGYRGYVRIPLSLLASAATGQQQPLGPTPMALHTVGPTAPTPEQAGKQALASAAQGILNHPQVQQALAQVPGGKEAAAILTNPAARKVIGDTIKKLKFW